jgi:hypothetical protein
VSGNLGTNIVCSMPLGLSLAAPTKKGFCAVVADTCAVVGPAYSFRIIPMRRTARLRSMQWHWSIWGESIAEPIEALCCGV